MTYLDTLDPLAIRRDTPVPYHYQLSELLRQEIDVGRLKVGDKIPVEEELCAHFSLSRTTVRKALDALVTLGLVRREQGRGTFVAEPKLVESMVNRQIGFFDDMAARGIKVVSRVLELRQTAPSPAVARALDLAPGATVIEIRRVRSIADQPVVVTSSSVPYDFCPSLLQADLTSIGLHQFLREHAGFKTGRFKSFIEAVGANEMEARLLGVKLGAPLMSIESTVFLPDGRPIDHFTSVHRGDRLRFIIESQGLGWEPGETKQS